MFQHGKTGTHFCQVIAITRGPDYACTRREFIQHLPPRVNDDRVAIGFSPTDMVTTLVSRYHVTQVFNGACPHQHMPVRLAGYRSEG